MNQQPEEKKKLLILIPAFEASQHITSVIDRIPESLSDDFIVEILIIDDASKDDTPSAAADHLQNQSPIPEWTIYTNPINQGYGGNQKLGYRYAIDNSFDVVVMVHGDGQYPPEEIGPLAFLALQHGAAFGSRMSKKSQAIKL